MVRRWPIYILLDCSESTSPESREQIASAFSILLSRLKSDPYALELVYLSVISFGSNARIELPLTGLVDFERPELAKLGTGRVLGEALALVTDTAKEEVKKREEEGEQRNFEPFVFIITAGSPTDDWTKGLKLFKSCRWGNVICCATNDADQDILRQVSEGFVIELNSAEEAFNTLDLYSWVEASVKTSPEPPFFDPPIPKATPVTAKKLGTIIQLTDKEGAVFEYDEQSPAESKDYTDEIFFSPDLQVTFFSPVLVATEAFVFNSSMVGSLRIVLGSEDPVCPLHVAEAFNDSFEGSTLRVVEKAGHNLPHEVVREEIMCLMNS